MRSTWWKKGDYNAICDECGFKFKASELKERYDGMRVCSDDWEPRHPSEKTIPVRGPNKLPWTRPEATDTFINEAICTPITRQGVADYGTADCAAADYDLGNR